MAPKLLPTHVNEALIEYRNHTERFCQWLSTAARDTGTVDHLFETSTLFHLRNTAKVPISSLVPLAKAVVEEETAQVPYEIFTRLERAISGRKEVNAFFVRFYNSEEADKEGNFTHQHIIAVLEKVLAILGAKRVYLNSPTYADAAPASPANDPTLNLFERLREVSLDDALSTRSHSSSGESSGTLYCLDERSAIDHQRDKISLAIFNLFTKATTIREVVKDAWQEFRGGDIALHTAAFTTNAAIAKLEALNSEFESNTEVEMDYFQVLAFVHSQFSQDDEDEFFFYHHGEARAFTYNHNGRQKDAEHMLCQSTADLLLSFTEPNQMPRRYTSEERDLLTCLARLEALGTAVYKEPDEPFKADLTYRAAHVLLRRREFHPWAIFAVQVLQDTHDHSEPGRDANIGEAMLVDIVKSINERYQHLIDVTEEPKTYIKKAQTLISNNQGQMPPNLPRKLNAKDHAGLIRGESSIQEILNFSVYDYHLGLTGLLIGRMLLQLHHFGLSVAKEENCMAVAAHLYNAFHQRKFLPKDVEWEDMDWFIEKQTKELIFDGPAPRNAEDIAASIVRRLDEFSCAIQYTYVAKHGWFPAEKPGWDRLTGVHLGNNIAALADIVVSNSLSKKEFARQGVANKLVQLKLLLEEDSFPLSFDFLALHHRCLELLRRVQIKLTEGIDHKGLDLNSVYNTTLVVYTIIAASKPRPISAIQVLTARYLRELIYDNGGVGLRDAKGLQAKCYVPSA